MKIKQIRTFVIGDIHGGLKALKQVIVEVKPQKEDTFIFLGDYVDGWSESAQVLDFLLEFKTKHQCIFIKGNHDAWCEEWLKTDTYKDIWYKQGGKATIESYQNYSKEKKKEHLNFLESMLLFHIDENNRLFVHAGFTSMRGPQKETVKTNYYWDRTLWEMATSLDKNLTEMDVFYPKRLKLFKEIYIGHTSTTDYKISKPFQAANLWNIDTGAAYTGRLSILDIETKEHWQSETLTCLYPNENGRNSE